MDQAFDFGGFLSWFWGEMASNLFAILFLALLAQLRKPLRSLLLHGSARMKGLARWYQRRKLLHIRRYRFDLAWLQRSVSRGHLCAAIFILWYGGWALAVGLTEVLVYSSSGEPLMNSPWTVMLWSTPVYLAEVGWIYFSDRASEVIKYRQKVKIWRFRHR